MFLLDKEHPRCVDPSSPIGSLEVVVKSCFHDMELLRHRFIGIRGMEMLVLDGKLDWINQYGVIVEVIGSSNVSTSHSKT